MNPTRAEGEAPARHAKMEETILSWQPKRFLGCLHLHTVAAPLHPTSTAHDGQPG
jgi:hypothetical protein